MLRFQKLEGLFAALPTATDKHDAAKKYDGSD